MIYDDVIMRTIVDLPDKQIAALGDFCAVEKISRAEAIRRAVDRLLESRASVNRESAFGAWKPGTDSRHMIDAIRDEWE